MDPSTHRVRSVLRCRCVWSEEVQGVPFLRTGRPPAVGQRIYAQVSYTHDGSHPDNYRGWARMVGEVTEVLPTPPVGLYAVYPGSRATLSESELAKLRASMPPLDPSMTVACTCSAVHSMEHVLANDGAVHGQAVKATLQLSCDDEGELEPQLAGKWDAVLRVDDTKANIWQICSFTQQHA